VCGRINHCIQGGVGDGDGSEDDEEGSKRRRAEAAVARGAPSLPPASWGAPLLSPLPSFMTSWEPSPMEMGSMGEAKMWLFVAAISGWRSPPRVRFPPLYSFSDFCHPI
jgi:hypothetical protein